MKVPRGLAIDGGTPLRGTPMPGWPSHGEAEIAAVTGSDREAIKSRLRYALGRLRRGMGDSL